MNLFIGEEMDWNRGLRSLPALAVDGMNSLRDQQPISCAPNSPQASLHCCHEPASSVWFAQALLETIFSQHRKLAWCLPICGLLGKRGENGGLPLHPLLPTELLLDPTTDSTEVASLQLEHSMDVKG